MRKMRLSVLAAAVMMGVGYGSLSRASAIFVTLTDGDKGGTTSFSGTANHWGASSDATLAANAAPNAGYAYVVMGTTASKSLLRTSTSAGATFGGQSLQLDDGANLLMKFAGTTTVNGLIMNGGVVELDGTGNATLAGTISLNPGTTSYINADNGQGLTVSSTIGGNGALIVNGADALFAANTTALFTASPSYRADNPPAANPAPINGNVTLSHTNNYSGGTTVSLGKLLATIDGAFGTGNVNMLTGGGLTESGGATNNYVADSATLTLSSASGGLDTLNYTGTDTVTSLIINGVTQFPGVYGAVGSSAANQNAVFAGAGTITVTGVPEPTALALGTLAAVGLLRRRRLA